MSLKFVFHQNGHNRKYTLMSKGNAKSLRQTSDMFGFAASSPEIPRKKPRGGENHSQMLNANNLSVTTEVIKRSRGKKNRPGRELLLRVQNWPRSRELQGGWGGGGGGRSGVCVYSESYTSICRPCGHGF